MEIGVILPDEQITFNGKNRKSEKKSVDSQKAIAWAENDIYFNELTMGEAIRQLEERFDVTISFEKDKLKKCRFTATFIQNESIDQILEVICEFNNATYTKKDEQTIIISGDGC
jgi:ferric-dicitrate binding protein FerR (iron transport regulator)